MRNFFRELDSNLSSALSPVVKWIIYLCTGIYILLLLVGPFSGAGAEAIIRLLGASVSDTILKGRIWQLVTYAFVHGGFGHLFFNLLALYFFGQRLEYRWGSGPFARFCIIVGAGAVLTHLAVVGLRHAATGAPMTDLIIGIKRKNKVLQRKAAATELSVTAPGKGPRKTGSMSRNHRGRQPLPAQPRFLKETVQARPQQ